MKVYVVTEGCYSDYNIRAVFLSEEEAKIYCAVMYDTEQNTEDLEIEEYDTDADHVEAVAGAEVHYEVVIRKGFAGDWSSVRTHMTLKPRAPFEFEKWSSRCDGRYRAVLDTDDKDKILKIFRDWLAQKKAEEAGI